MDTANACRKISVVIPCYNSEKTIGFILQKTLDVLQTYSGTYEIITVNDGSADGTWGILQNFAHSCSHIKAINLSQNYGQHCALMAAYRAVTGDIVVGLDDDGEHDPADMFKLIDKLDEGYDFVCAVWLQGKKSSFLRNMGTVLNNWMAHTLINKPKNIEISSFYVERRFVTDQIKKCNNPFPYIAGLMLQATNRLANVELPKHERLSGKSGYTLKKLLSLWINGFTAFSVKPLRVATLSGFLCACAGFLYLLYTVIRKLLVNDILLGYSSLLAVLLFIGGMIMFMLGIVGEYIGRIYILANSAPQYVIRDALNCEEQAGQ